MTLHRNPAALLVLALAACGPERAPDPAPGTAAPVVPAATSAPTAAAPSPPTLRSTDLSCTYPVDGKHDTAATVLARLGKDARRATVTGAEGMEFPGIVLWQGDPQREIELVFDEESKDERIAALTITAEKSTWRVAGVGIGDAIGAVEKVNGKPFSIWGFDWDYGGYLTERSGGALEKLPGGCNISLRFSPAENAETYPDGISGEVELKSSDPRLKQVGAAVSEVGLMW